ncbi:protein VI precursor [Human adenovirus 21]|uniref:Pre-protein VI n=1 Tax=Human adenovirus 21 TaxID=32608 RepID=A0A0B4SIF3_9ADEN|nr:protein VI precursor [Human adenovirus 21]
MEDINFSSLAPRHGTRPYMGTWSDIGTSQLNGGAFNWSSIWSGLKNFGSTIKTYGNKAWNSSTGQALRNKLKEQNFQQKVVDGIASGINGVVDLANQAVQKQINSRLDPPPSAPGEMEVEEDLPPLEKRGDKRPRPDLEETLVTRSDNPPSYEEAVKLGMPTTRPVAPMATGVMKPSQTHRPATLDLPPPAVAAPARKPVATPKPVAVARPHPGGTPRPNANWQSTLNSIVGLGVQSVKRRRCF